MRLGYAISLLLSALATLILSHAALRVITGEVQLTRWPTITLSNKPLMFWLILMTVSIWLYILAQKEKNTWVKWLIRGLAPVVVYGLALALGEAYTARLRSLS